MKNNRWAYHLLTLAIMSVWGVTFISTKVLLYAGLSPNNIFVLRFLISYIGIWPLCLLDKDGRSRKLLPDSVKDELLFVLAGITGGSLYFFAENYALSYTQACNVSFIVSSAPVFTIFFTILAIKFLRGPIVDGLEKVKISWPLVLGTVLCLLGMACVLFGADPKASPAFISAIFPHQAVAEAPASFSLPKGELLSIVSAASWAIYSIFMAQLTEKYGSFFATRKVFFWGLVTIMPFVLNDVPPVEVFADAGVIFNVFLLSVVASLACFVLWNRVMTVLGNVTTTNYVYLNPFFTLWAAYIFLDESMNAVTAVGSAAIIIGLVMTTRAGNMRNEEKTIK